MRLLLPCLLLLALPLAARAQEGLDQATPVDTATAHALLMQATRQYPRFAQALRDVREHDPLLRRLVVVEASGPPGSPAAAFPNGAVRLDRRFLEQPRPGYDDNRLVVVLYHEVGHLHYFAQVPPARRTPEASEQAAFEYSLLKTKELAAAGNCGPLQAGLRFMRLRGQLGRPNDPHTQALRALLPSPLFAGYQQYAAAHCPAQP